MKYEYLYTISPLILADMIPNKASVASIISDYFYLFNIYSDNPYIVRMYMKFIDEHFDFAFTELNYQMVQYQYPEIYKDDEFKKIEFINYHYDLKGYSRLDLSYHSNKFEILDSIFDYNQTIYFNDYALGDLIVLGDMKLEEKVNILPNLLTLLNYVKYKPERDYLQTLLYQYSEYEGCLMDYLMNPEIYIDSGCIVEPMIILYRLKTFVNHTLEERLEI